jgi:hypothetical protein
MNHTTTGGPAFPAHTIAMHEGMTLRDYFAAKAMLGMISADYSIDPKYVPDIAASAYVLADAMLKAREA